MSKIIFFILVLFFYSSSLTAQQWETSSLIDRFSNEVIYDIGFGNGRIWILSEFGLYSVETERIITYKFDKNTKGLMDNFISNINVNTDRNLFTRLMVDNNILWLISNDLRTILKIQNDTIRNYTFDFHKDKNLIPLNVNSEKGQLWLFFSYYDDNKMQKDIYFLRDENFNKYSLGEDFSKIKLFFVLNGFKFMVYETELYSSVKIDYFIKMIPEDSLTLITFNKNSNIEHNFQYTHDSGEIYILSSDSTLLRISLLKSSLSSQIRNIRINYPLSLNVHFLVKGYYMYISSFDGIIQINIDNNESFLLKPLDFSKNCFTGFDKLKLKDNKVWAIYGNGLKYKCDMDRYGFAVVNLTDR